MYVNVFTWTGQGQCKLLSWCCPQAWTSLVPCDSMVLRVISRAHPINYSECRIIHEIRTCIRIRYTHAFYTIIHLVFFGNKGSLCNYTSWAVVDVSETNVLGMPQNTRNLLTNIIISYTELDRSWLWLLIENTIVTITIKFDKTANISERMNQNLWLVFTSCVYRE